MKPDTCHVLLLLIHSLQQDLFIYKSIIQAQYEERIEEQASNLCKYRSDRLKNIEFLHKRKYYNTNGEDTECSPGKLLKLLRNKLHEKESVIEELERKFQEYQEKGRAKMVVFEDDDHENKMLAKENEDFKEEVFKPHNEISRLENALKRSEKEKYLLDKQVQRMSKMEADEQTVQKLIETQEQMKAELENERSLVKNLQQEKKEDTETKVQSVLVWHRKKENEHGRSQGTMFDSYNYWRKRKSVICFTFALCCVEYNLQLEK
ncbi:LOW QUALITY PROTEIN: uncharacterized protein C10orf67 homolog, mitochondrial [Ciconia maguari]